MVALLSTILARVRAFLRSGDLEEDFDEELRAHLDISTEEKIRAGMEPDAARRAARLELGNVTSLRESARDARGLPWLDTFLLDLKLSVRVARKHWGLSLVSGVAMAVAISIAVLVFSFLQVVFGSTLPLPDGDQVVTVQIWDEAAQRRSDTSMAHLEHWRERVQSLEDLGAFRTVRRNLILGEEEHGRRVESVAVAEMSAAGFDLARARPFLGRTLQESDELPGAEPVLVLGHGEWTRRFGADASVLGQKIRLSDRRYTVVGVMPEGFVFPVRHGFWTALHRDATRPLHRDVEAAVFARLADGVSDRQAEGDLAAAGFGHDPRIPAERERELTARVVPYALGLTASDTSRTQVDFIVRLLLLAGALLLAPPCLNIAILVYARLLTRSRELATRRALGAGGGRILAQLFLEMFVVSATAALAALVVTQSALRWAAARLERETAGGLPFWLDFNLGPRAVLFAFGLAVLAAALTGLLPGIGALRRSGRGGLRALGTDHDPRLGRPGRLLIALQVAICLAALPATLELSWGTVNEAVLGPGFEAADYLTAELSMEGLDPATTPAAGVSAGAVDETTGHSLVRYADRRSRLGRLLRTEPGALDVSFASVPGDEPWRVVEFSRQRPASKEGSTQPHDDPVHSMLVRTNIADRDFFSTLDISLLAGALFEAADFEQPTARVLVNAAFVRQLGPGIDPVGGFLRYGRALDGREPRDPATADEPTWHQIVGVVADRPTPADHGTVYQPASPAVAPPSHLLVHMAPGTTLRDDRLRELATSVDPTLHVETVQGLDEVYRDQQVGNNIGMAAIAGVTTSALLLAAAGVFAVVTFTVRRRRREMAIRTALGAPPRSLLATVFRRAFAQLALGAAAGVGLAVALDLVLPAERIGGATIPGVVPATTVALLCLGLLTAYFPARRGLSLDPVDELKEN